MKLQSTALFVQVLASMISKADLDARHDQELGIGDGTISLARILQAYENVLCSHGLSAATDTVYYQLLLRLSLDPSPNWWDRLQHLRVAHRADHKPGHFPSSATIFSDVQRASTDNATKAVQHQMTYLPPDTPAFTPLQPLSTNIPCLSTGRPPHAQNSVRKIAARACSTRLLDPGTWLQQENAAHAQQGGEQSSHVLDSEALEAHDVSPLQQADWHNQFAELSPGLTNQAHHAKRIAQAIAHTWSTAVKFCDCSLLRRALSAWQVNAAQQRREVCRLVAAALLRRALAAWVHLLVLQQKTDSAVQGHAAKRKLRVSLRHWQQSVLQAALQTARARAHHRHALQRACLWRWRVLTQSRRKSRAADAHAALHVKRKAFATWHGSLQPDASSMVVDALPGNIATPLPDNNKQWPHGSSTCLHSLSVEDVCDARQARQVGMLTHCPLTNQAQSFVGYGHAA